MLINTVLGGADNLRQIRICIINNIHITIIHILIILVLILITIIIQVIIRTTKSYNRYYYRYYYINRYYRYTTGIIII